MQYEMAATIKAAKIGMHSWRKIVDCFVTFFDIERKQLTMSEYSWKQLGTDHGPIESGVYESPRGDGKRPEVVKWWTMDPKMELELRLSDFANTMHNFDPAKIETISLIYTGDHGLSKLRFGSKLVI